MDAALVSALIWSWRSSRRPIQLGLDFNPAPLERSGLAPAALASQPAASGALPKPRAALSRQSSDCPVSVGPFQSRLQFGPTLCLTALFPRPGRPALPAAETNHPKPSARSEFLSLVHNRARLEPFRH